VGTGNKNKSKVQYRALLRRRDGSIVEFTPYGVERITRDAIRVNLNKAKALFPSAVCRMESPEGPIHMLIGMDHMKDAPRKRDRAEGVVLYHSEFNTRYVACGNMSQEPLDQAHRRPVVKVLSCCNGLFNPPRIHTHRSHGNGVTTQMPRLQELQRVSVPHGQPNLQGEHGVRDQTEQAATRRG
jgi:hypothetical protein